MFLKSFFLIISFILFLIPMSIKGVSTYTISLVILVILSFLMKVRFTKTAIFMIASLICLLAFNLVNVFFHFSFEIYLIKVTLIGIVLFINALLLVSCYQKIYGHETEKEILKSLLFVASLNSLFAILFIVSGALRSFFYLYLDTNPLNAHHMNLGIRSSGLFYFGASILSAFNFIVMYLSSVFYSVYGTTKKDKLFAMVAFLFSIIGIFLSGRFGFMLSLVGIFVVMVLPERYHLIKKKQFIPYLFILVSVSIPLIYSYYDVVELAFNRTFELFINYFDGNGFVSESTSVLGNMYFFPENIILGEGSFGRDSDSKYIPSDAGYILMLFYSGFLGVVVYFSHFLFVLSLGINRYSKYKLFGDKISIRILILCLFVLVVGNFKDVYFYGSQGVTQIFMIAVALFCRKLKY